MATINNMMSANRVASNSNTKNEISKLRKEMGELNKDKSLTSEQLAEKRKEYTEKIDKLTAEVSAEREASMASVQNSMGGFFGGNFDNNSTGFDFIFGANAAMSNLMTINSARLGIESRARNLLAEIRMDQMRGIDTSMKKEALANLTENLNVMDKNLGNNIDNALKEPAPGKGANAPSAIDRINSDLKKTQEAEEKKVQEKYGERKTDET